MMRENELRLNCNGFIVKRLDSDFSKMYKKRGILLNYSGIEGYTWPIDNYSEGIEKDEIEYLYNYVWDNIQSTQKSGDFLAVCDNVDFIERYIIACKKMGYEIEILFCESEKRTPKCSVNLSDKSMFEFIGFDYAYAGEDYYSCIFQDVPRIEEMKDILLNKNGLFEKEEEVINFINLRNSLRMTKPKISFEFGEFVIYRLWRFIGQIPIKLNR